ncbi:BTB/POZ domain-containing protein KCTD9 [Anthonomus grandis grandis]|uniref:BTB/POZ domain-containing protein KCTD9 n=1 Tax=Anthonomus grandis grandis TaxID=2921223 RepID=UPI0021659557|nr:BTB/POZ domain-containing protein KCTD9 [Anthonomus grandis grandis]
MMSFKSRKITLVLNGDVGLPQTVVIPDEANEFYDKVICSLTQFATIKKETLKLYLEDGSEIINIDLIRNKDKVYVSNGENFKKVQTNNEWITLNVGGKYFTTSKRTLTSNEPDSMLARMFSDEHNLLSPSSQDKNGAYLIDRSPRYFEPILNYLRCGQLVYNKNINPEGILAEARFFGIESLIPVLESALSTPTASRDKAPLTRRDVIDSLIRSSNATELRYQGVNLEGADLSKLDLRSINFKYANMQGCNLTGANLSWCCLERADLSHAILDNAQLLGVKGLRATMEGASMRNCNFKDPAGARANLEGVNLKGACLEDSDMGSVNLRIANCKNANLKNCDLRAAVLAGADLENCDLSGSDLHEANLRGANLKDAAFELMLTPLHMSQTVR